MTGLFCAVSVLQIHSEELLEEFEVNSIAISWDNFQGGSHFIEIYREKVEKSSLEVRGVGFA